MTMLVAMVALTATPLHAAPLLSPPSGNPQTIDFTTDPLLTFASAESPPGAFLDSVRAAAFGHPDFAAAAAGTDEARAARVEARAALFPQFSAQLIAARSVASDFGSFTALVESLQPSARTDLQLSADQLLFDFGATGQRIASASASIRAARAAQDAQASATAIAAIAAWYDVLTGRAEAAISDAEVARLSAGFVATRYDVFDRNRDYDVRAQVTLRIGLSAGGAEAARAHQAEARARAARFAADAVAQPRPE